MDRGAPGCHRPASTTSGHTCAILLLSRSVNPKVVSEMLSYSSVVITLDIYSHVLPNIQDVTAAAMEDSQKTPA